MAKKKKKRVTFSSPIITIPQLVATKTTADSSASDADTEGESTDCESTKSETSETKEQQKKSNSDTVTSENESSKKNPPPPSSTKAVKKKARNGKDLLALMALVASMGNTSSSSSSEDKDDDNSSFVTSSCSSSSSSTSDSDAAKHKKRKNHKSALKEGKKNSVSASHSLQPSLMPRHTATLTSGTLNIIDRPSFTQVYKSCYPYQIKLRPTRQQHDVSPSSTSSHSSSDNDSETHSGSGKVTWTKEDCATLAILEARQRSLKWLDLQAEFYNLTGNMIDAEDLRMKFEKDAAIMDAKADRREKKLQDAVEEEQVEKGTEAGTDDNIKEQQTGKQHKKKKNVFDETDDLMKQAIKAMANLAAN